MFAKNETKFRVFQARIRFQALQNNFTADSQILKELNRIHFAWFEVNEN